MYDDNLARQSLAIAAAIGVASSGEKAEARRMDAGGAPVFWRQVARLGISQFQEPQWLHFARLVAILTPSSAQTSIHQNGRQLGAALAGAGLSEPRFARLLAARGPARLNALERAVRMLARAHPTLDVVSLASFVFDRDGNALARSYYQRLDHSEIERTEHA